MAFATGTKLGLYEIQSSLGAGGMGEVYRASDTKLGRDVALKVLPAEMARDAERLLRFRREAKALAQLDHPNIVTIYSVEECEGVHFLTMQLIEGLPLDQVISQDGLPVDQIVEIAQALAEALAAAHEKGIVHRDMKPANVMISDRGRVKVLDFGLAKDTREANHGDATMTSDDRTQVGAIMGTPPYMSPEQVSGRLLDHRTDIFSLGVMLHEMSTGQRPFTGGSSAELVSAILRDTPPSVTELRADLPSDLARIIRRCMEKDPSDRLQTARDVSKEFRDLVRQGSSSLSHVSAVASRMAPAPDSSSASAAEAFRIAVLPFKYKGTDAELQAFAEGISEEIITGMSRFSYLRVMTHSAPSHFGDAIEESGSVVKAPGARFVMEGSIRQAGSRLRITVQLVDVSTGSHLWAETYERTFTADAIFDLQDDLVPRIVSTVSDMNGVLARSMSETVRSKTPEQLSPYEAVLRSFGYIERITADELAIALSCLEVAIKKAPAYADAWAMMAWMCIQDDVHDFHLRPDPMKRGVGAARQAVAVGPNNHLAHSVLAQAIYFQKDFQSFRNAAERAVALNPMDGNTIAFLGELMTQAGFEERGMELVARAKQLNPNHPGWYWFANFYNAYRQGDDRGALSFVLKVSHNHFGVHMMLAAAYGQLGERKAAAKALRETLQLKPDLASVVRRFTAKWYNPEYCERLIDGLIKAGLEIPEEGVASAPALDDLSRPAKVDSSLAHASEDFWIAVLPFKWPSGEGELGRVADGLTEDVTSGLSRFPYLRVISHNSAMAYQRGSEDARVVGRALGARYLLEGSVRQGARRVSAQLVDASTGTQLWAETYNREIGNGNPFEIQDDLTDRIVATVADTQGALVRSMAASIRERPVEGLSVSELILRYHSGVIQQAAVAEHAVVRAGLERALEREPNHAEGWATLADIYSWEYALRMNPLPDSLERARRAAQRAVDIDPTSQMGWAGLAVAYFFARDFKAFYPAADRAIALNPRRSTLLGYIGTFLFNAGEWEKGHKLVQRAMSLNPHYPGWFYFVPFLYHYRKNEYEKALFAAKQANMPNDPWNYLYIAAACGQLQLKVETAAAISGLERQSPAYLDLTVVREDAEKWFAGKELIDHLLEGLRKAGLASRG